ncbi:MULTISPECIES: alpha/beta fold hydrolase [unclassified Streptococcus]|uniref:alpha/beta fold hydrolase n=1 Tax=unclassified Streptococcus TaxID=2608887 RepID=UPI001071E005|nr:MULTISPECIES: alpha/beta hydrolase [unclassified Streptococcus]MBF0787189.1 alpha/beta hydrolase [Streptococcus sp. 19428wC2_LYSM12]MCQ9212096.1 alpha/beta hydrolase [Streptococcus sp. B01]MCQ9213425.1 alpha/beta hydrolase [Streptococcus sp. O1]TFV05938.1 alpha/beta fold hydrolase [Streptococcus sp. LYSM12]
MTKVTRWRFGPRQTSAILWAIDEPKAIIQIVHGMIEQMERYDEFARFLNQAGYAVIGHDHVGHGHTVRRQEDYGVFPGGWHVLIEDVQGLHEEIRMRYPNLPLIIMGHSMGSYITRLYLAEHGIDVQASILMGTGQEPLLKTRAGIHLVKMLTGIYGPLHRSKLVEAMTTGHFNRHFSPTKTSADWLTRDRNEVDNYLTNPRHQFRPTTSMYEALFTFANYAAQTNWIDKIPKNLPLLLISGQEDPVGECGKGVKRFYDLLVKLGCSRVSFTLYPEARHEILNEWNKEEVMLDILKWINGVV